MSNSDLYQEVRLYGGEKDGGTTTFPPSWKIRDVLYSLTLEGEKSINKMFAGPDRTAAEQTFSVLAYKYNKTEMSQRDNGDIFYIHKYYREESLDR